MLPLLWMEMVDGVLKKKGSRNAGHTEGLKTIENIITESLKQEIRYLNTLHIFYRKLEKTKARNQFFIQNF